MQSVLTMIIRRPWVGTALRLALIYFFAGAGSIIVLNDYLPEEYTTIADYAGFRSYIDWALLMGTSLAVFIGLNFAFRSIYEKNTANERAHTEITQLTRKLINAQEDERSRMAALLHEDLSQDLAAFKMILQKSCAAGDVNTLSAELDKVLEKIRTMAQDLSPIGLIHLGITTAVDRFLKTSSSLATLDINYHLEPVDHYFQGGWDANFYRLIQEAVTNAIHHSGATELKVDVRDDENQVIQVTVSDNGRGFDTSTLNGKNGTNGKKGVVDPGNVSNGKDGLGLRLMYQRVELLKGTLHIDSGPGGTTVKIRVPRQTPAPKP